MKQTSMRLWREALEELWRRRLRTALTLLGLIFGVGAIVAMQAVGEGSRREALRLVQSLGLQNLIVESLPVEGDLLQERRARSLGLSRRDAESLRDSLPAVDAFAAEKRLRTFAVSSDQHSSDAGASGILPDYFELTHLQLASGRALSVEDQDRAAAVAVLGHQVASRLFPQGDALGQLVKVNHVWLEVVGVLADRDLSRAQFEGVKLGLDSNRVFLPLSTALQRFRFQPMEDELDRILLRVNDPQQLAASAQLAQAMLAQRHAGVDDFNLIVPAQLYQQNQQTQRIFRIVMAAIAAVSLLVGGIGIMNIMLANVLERQREIGLLRALGARRSDIVAQFMRETTVVCALGALSGVVFGVVLAYVIATLAAWQVAWAPLPIVLATLVCAGVGIGFGVYPARRAAALDPIAALRTE